MRHSIRWLLAAMLFLTLMITLGTMSASAAPMHRAQINAPIAGEPWPGPGLIAGEPWPGPGQAA
ncbi:MAG TPA: hypothetical protein VFV38_04340 [Ktedonobacteraceae bacterium]|nr:hypothetical protein [Ktedonobacteraceae bacterium]